MLGFIAGAAAGGFVGGFVSGLIEGLRAGAPLGTALQGAFVSGLMGGVMGAAGAGLILLGVPWQLLFVASFGIAASQGEEGVEDWLGSFIGAQIGGYFAWQIPYVQQAQYKSDFEMDSGTGQAAGNGAKTIPITKGGTKNVWGSDEFCQSIKQIWIKYRNNPAMRETMENEISAIVRAAEDAVKAGKFPKSGLDAVYTAEKIATRLPKNAGAIAFGALRILNIAGWVVTAMWPSVANAPTLQNYNAPPGYSEPPSEKPKACYPE